MKNLSRFDLIMIISFVVIGLLGAGSWYYLSGVLDSAKDDVSNANSEFMTNSQKMVYLPDQHNIQTLSENIALMKSQFEPIVKNTLRNPQNKLSTAVDKDTVAWKHDLDDEVRRLTAAAKLHGVDIPSKYYFSFARYLSQAPAEDKTAALSKQLIMVEAFADILVSAPVKKISAIRRTYEEDPDSGGNAKDGDCLVGHAVKSSSGTYIAYPFEVDFDANTDALRKVINGLVQSPYVFVIRSVNVQNTKLGSPQISDLDRMAGAQPSSILDSPGEVSSNKSTVGPQYLFGSESLHVRMRFDLIEWLGTPAATKPGTPAPAPTPPPPAGN